jgi:hypothetical protein
VEVLRLPRSDICEMDVRADWARMAKRSGRGCSSCSVTETRTCSLISYIEIRQFAYDVMISLQILARDVEGERSFGHLFQEHVASDCGNEPTGAWQRLTEGCLGDGDPEIRESGISKLGELYK